MNYQEYIDISLGQIIRCQITRSGQTQEIFDDLILAAETGGCFQDYGDPRSRQSSPGILFKLPTDHHHLESPHLRSFPQSCLGKTNSDTFTIPRTSECETLNSTTGRWELETLSFTEATPSEITEFKARGRTFWA